MEIAVRSAPTTERKQIGSVQGTPASTSRAISPGRIHWIRLPIVSSVVSQASYDSLPVTRRYCYTANYSYLMSIKIVYGF